MKKKYLVAISVAVWGVLIGIGIKTQAQRKFSDITLTNAEAIASGENQDSKGPGSLSKCGATMSDGSICSTFILTCLAYNPESCSEVSCSSKHGYDDDL